MRFVLSDGNVQPWELRSYLPGFLCSLPVSLKKKSLRSESVMRFVLSDGDVQPWELRSILPGFFM
jgi:hypothetical protein